MTWDTTYDIRYQGYNSIHSAAKDQLTTRCRTQTLANELIACGEGDFIAEEPIKIRISLLYPIRKVATGKRSVYILMK
jgi:hypothetical protein